MCPDGLPDRPSELVCAWIDAYYSHRDEELIELAHDDIEIRPRIGHGQRRYEGRDGLQRWLDYTRPSRSEIDAYSTVDLHDGRVLAEAELEGMRIVAIFEVRAGKIASVTMYISDRELLARLGEIEVPEQSRAHHRVSRTPSSNAGAERDTTAAI